MSASSKHTTSGTLGITVLGDFVVSEGVPAVLENLQRVGATAVALNPTVTAPADEQTGKFQPPADAGHSPRRFDRRLFGQTALWLRSAVSFHPHTELYRDSPYGPRQANELTDDLGGLIAEFIAACTSANIDVYLQIGAAEPTGLRDEDRPRLPDGSLPSGRIADIASLPSPAVRAYNQAYAADLVRAYPSITGFRIDWPEYPCYTPDEVFQDFGPHVADWAGAHGFDLESIRNGVLHFQSVLQGGVSNELLRALAEVNHGRAALQDWLSQFPAVIDWLKLKAALSVNLIAGWRKLVDDLEGPRRQLSVHAFMPPFSTLTGFDFAAAATLADSISPKFYTMHWRLMVQQWGQWLLKHNPHCDESLLTQALVNLLQLADQSAPHETLADYHYPAPDEPHRIGLQAQQAKTQEVFAAVEGQAEVFPLVHGYGPVDDFALRLEVGLAGGVDGVWVNRYGYLSDAKLDVIAASFPAARRR